MESRLKFEIERQPDQFTCGPTCLQAVYAYFGDGLPLQQVIHETPRLENGGTLAVQLACHALKRGYHATIYTWNLQVFDPTWFRSPEISPEVWLRQQMQAKKESRRLQQASEAYLEFLALGGELKMEDLTGQLIRRYLKKHIPILTGLSSTYLYGEPREFGKNSRPDPVRGTPQGHFVVLCGYDAESRTVRIADPFHPNPLAKDDQRYEVPLDRVMCAIMLGILTYDANLLILRPQQP